MSSRHKYPDTPLTEDMKTLLESAFGEAEAAGLVKYLVADVIDVIQEAANHPDGVEAAHAQLEKLCSLYLGGDIEDEDLDTSESQGPSW